LDDEAPAQLASSADSAATRSNRRTRLTPVKREQLTTPRALRDRRAALLRGLQGFSAASKYIVTAIVLLVAVSIDALARRGTKA
jgi:hypothetical protein